jgi:hypothetical protein
MRGVRSTVAALQGRLGRAGNAHGTWRTGLAATLAVLVASGTIGMAASGQGRPGDRRQPPHDREVEAAAARVMETVRSDSPAEDGAALVEPPHEPLDRPAAWSDLQRTVTIIGAHIEDRRPGRGERSFLPLVRQSHRWAERALTSLIQVETDVAAALQHLSHAARMLSLARAAVHPGSADHVLADRTLRALALVGARLAADGIARAHDAGLRDDRLVEAQRALDEGLMLVDAGQYQAALGQFGPGVLVGNVPWFSLDMYEQNIRNAFDSETLGYQYAIARQGQLVRFGQNGVARTAADPPVTLQLAHKEMNIASVSKTLTATVLVQLLQQKGVSVDSSISPWLPSNWIKGPGIAQLTFRDLLTHKSGLNGNQGGPYDLASLQGYIAAGVTPADKAVFTYQNGNFALFRVAIPYLRYGQLGMQLIIALGAPFISPEQTIAALYIDTVRTSAFEPTGFIQADCEPNDVSQTLLYRFPYDGSAGIQNGDWTLLCGSGGWYMSTIELVGFMAHRRFTNTIMSPTARALMDNGFLGWMDPAQYSWTTGKYGVYRNHGGDLLYDPEPKRGMRACIMEYPSGVQTAVLINSRGGNHKYQCRELSEAYDNAFVIP